MAGLFSRIRTSLKREWWEEHPLSLIFFGLFLFATITSLITTVPEKGWVGWYQDWSNNASTEMLQLFLMTRISDRVPDKGSAEAKDPEEVEQERGKT